MNAWDTELCGLTERVVESLCEEGGLRGFVDSGCIYSMYR